MPKNKKKNFQALIVFVVLTETGNSSCAAFSALWQNVHVGNLYCKSLSIHFRHGRRRGRGLGTALFAAIQMEPWSHGAMEPRKCALALSRWWTAKSASWQRLFAINSSASRALLPVGCLINCFFSRCTSFIIICIIVCVFIKQPKQLRKISTEMPAGVNMR